MPFNEVIITIEGEPATKKVDTMVEVMKLAGLLLE
jgi:hypothetical protein